MANTVNQAEYDTFMTSWREKQERDRQESLAALEANPGPCTVVYYSYCRRHTKRFGTLMAAFKWSEAREAAELQYTDHYVLTDGSKLRKTVAQWDIARGE